MKGGSSQDQHAGMTAESRTKCVVKGPEEEDR